MSVELDQQCINAIRFLSVDMIQKANSGHPGLPLDAAPMAYVLWTRRLKYNPHNPQCFNRDRFVLSAGHGSALLYSLLHFTGFDLALDDIRQFRHWGSKTLGHPERGHTPGVDDVRKTKQKLGWPTESDFLIPDEAVAHLREAVKRGAQDEAAWNERMSAFAKAFPELAAELQCRQRDELPPGWDADIPIFSSDAKGLTTREASGKVMNSIAHKLPAVPSINFLSGGLSPEEATADLNAMNADFLDAPWLLSFSYGRALQQPVLQAWQGKEENVSAAQQALLKRARLNGAAQRGEYLPAMESAN